MTTPTGNALIDAISWGGAQWTVPNSGSLELTYYFADDFAYPWTDVEMDSYRAALQAFADIADFTIREVFVENDANLVAHSVSDSEMQQLTGSSGVLGFHEVPRSNGTTTQLHGHYNWAGYSLPESGWTWDPGGLAVGGYGFYTFIHELAHGLGGAHPHDTGGGSGLFPGVTSSSDTGTNDQNQGFFTVLSYNAGWPTVQDPEGDRIADYGYSGTPGAYDIALFQYYYGANQTHNHGNSTYVVPESGALVTIWDTGGIDRIIYNGSADAIINLNSATLDGTATGGGSPSYLPDTREQSYYGAFAIAADFMNALADEGTETGVIIENGIGGLGDDTVTGNGVANRLGGRSGNDSLLGLAGDDTLIGGAGDDALQGGQDNDRLNGGGDNDTLDGGAGDDILNGGDGNDEINSGSGVRDVLFGGAGEDLFVFDDGTGRDVLRDFQDDVDEIRLDQALWGGGLTELQVLDTYARDLGANTVLNFGGGDIVILIGVGDVSDLANDIVLV